MLLQASEEQRRKVAEAKDKINSMGNAVLGRLFTRWKKRMLRMKDVNRLKSKLHRKRQYNATKGCLLVRASAHLPHAHTPTTPFAIPEASAQNAMD